MMGLINLVLTHYTSLFIFIIASFILGKRILRRIDFNSVWESFAFSLAFGIGIIAYIVFFVGLFGLLYRWALSLILIGLIAAAILTTPSFFQSIKDVFISWRTIFAWLLDQKERLVFGGCLAAIVGSGILLPLYPPFDWDSIEYHLSVAKIYTQAHGLVFTEFLRYPVYSQLNHMLFTLMLMFSDDLSAQLIQYMFYLMIGVFIYAYGRRYFSRPVGVLAAAMWLGNFLAMQESIVADIDLGLVFFGTAGVLAFLNYYKNRKLSWLTLASILLGFAAAVKYTGLFWIGLCVLITLWIGYQEKDWRIPVLFGLVTGLVACPFYLRNMYYTGNPFFPYISIFFRENIWTKADLKILTGEQTSYGVARTLVNFIKLPLLLRSNTNLFHSSVTPYNRLYLAFLPVMMIVGILKRSFRLLWIFCLSFTIFWFLTPHVMRYLLPVFPLYCLLASAVFGYLLDSGWRLVQNKLPFSIPKSLTSLIYLIFILQAAFVTCRYNYRTIQDVRLPPTSAVEKAAFLQARLPSYSAYQLLNRTENVKSQRLYALFDEDMVYYYDGVFMGDWFGPARYSAITDVLSDSRKLYTELRKLGADYFLFQGNRSFDYNLPDDPFFNEKFQKIYDQDQVKLYKISTH